MKVNQLLDYFKMNTFHLFFLMALLIGANGCKKTELAPTGSLKINTTSNADASYYLMTEAAAGGSHLTLRDGNISGATSFVIDDLNPGDYVLGLSNNINHSQHAVQVTAGQQREYSF
ncbi:hypothetical protein [Spirosoma pollinicola]|uniref:Uncharacterized protein n=1 Tax=Spirosoma pollinicola TaxID=2057025 RepID=A0A2K8Z9F1_9BACT|nr:hypothetical protein [Spirosoma pollinicola]AUD06498.1 hypothetical protein CWM47_34425 [Spirosoma pollinicola]